jgi:hypothetical protein
MYWNYRIVNLKSQNGGDDWYALQEVSYDDDGKPTGYGSPCIGSKTLEQVHDLLTNWIRNAVDEEPLQEKDFE